MSEQIHVVVQRQLWSYKVLRWLNASTAEVQTPVGKIIVGKDDAVYALTVEEAIKKAYQEEKESLLELELEHAKMDDYINQIKKNLPKTLPLFRAAIRGLPK